MPAQVVILGGGVGGVLVANLLSRQLGPNGARIRIVDPTGMHMYQPGYLYVALGQAHGTWLGRDVRTLVPDTVELLIDEASGVDPAARTVALKRGDSLNYDFLVIATGARLVPTEVSGLSEGAHEFYSMQGAQRLREALRTFRGGRIVVGVAGMPYKCPPAPLEFTLMLEDELRRRRLKKVSHIDYLSPVNRAFTIESASELVTPIMEERGIQIHTLVNVESVDPAAREVISLEGETFPYGLLVLVPPHRGAAFLEESGLSDRGGWVPTDRETLRVREVDDVFALGDATDIPISKSGSTAHFEAPVIAERIAAAIEGRPAREKESRYKGKVTCFLEVGRSKATILVFDFDHPPRPPRPARIWHLAKWLFNRAYWWTVARGRF